MSDDYKLTQAHFRVFTNKVNEWAVALGLVDWRIFIDAKDLDEDTFAECLTDQQNHTATINVGKTWNEQPSEEFISEIAFHEICELLLSNIRIKLLEQYSFEVVDEMIHAVIRRLEHLVIRKQNNAKIAKLK